MSSAIQVGGEGAVAGEDLGLRVGVELVGQDVVDRQQQLDALLLRLVERGFGNVDLVGFDQRLAGGLAQRIEEGVGHAAADQQRVRLVEQVVDHVDLAGDLRAADDGDKRPVGFGQHLAEEVELLLHQQAGGGLRDVMRDAFGGGVGAVRAAEGVVDVDVAERRELLGEGWIVGLFFGVEAQVFQQQGLAGLKLARHLLRDFADAVGREGDILARLEDVIEQEAQAGDQRPQAHGFDRLALGPAEVRAEDDLGLVAQGVLDGGQRLADAGVVGDDAVLQRHVEVDANEHTLVREVEIPDRKFGHMEQG